MEEAVDAAELRTNLQEYEDQMKQVEALLLDQPENEEYQSIYGGLVQVVNLTKELLAETEQQDHDAATASASAAAPTVAAAAAAEPQPSSSTLPPTVAHQIKLAQQRAALAGHGSAAWAIGAEVQAKYSGDGLWYDASVTGVNEEGNFIVTFTAYGIQEVVLRHDIRQKAGAAQAGGAAIADYKGVDAPKRNSVNEEPEQLGEMPKWLEIQPTDDEKTRLKKKKLIKSFKNKQRFQQMDTVQKEKADAWKSFINKKGTKKKKSGGGLAGVNKKQSMFSVAEGTAAKVGVVGSGKGMTGYGKKKRHEFDVEQEGQQE
ncbi:hypothetical protein Ndes2526B_g00748 [Nannochloris sp. 'desiccata']|nr:hypothetical protein NADE_003898 [Chlorella desiccata (nom. nud.)]